MVGKEVTTTFIPELPIYMGNSSDECAIPDELRAKMAIEATHDGIWDYDPQTGMLYGNESFLLLIGEHAPVIILPLDEWLARLHKEDRIPFKEALFDHVRGGTTHFIVEHRIRHSDGSDRWMLIRGKKIESEHGKQQRITGTITDIHDRKQHELQLANQLDELRFALASEKVLMDELDRKNKELMELSITDGLTGLFNHRYLHERFDYEFKRARRYCATLSCILIDIDHFKKLNDTYGHQYGDYVLKQIAQLIKSKSREVDICGRYGGEEFMVISNVGEKNALQYAAKLNSAIQHHCFEHPSATINVTVSIGVAEYKSEIRTKQELIERSDKALYQAKNDGRNCVRLWKPDYDLDSEETDCSEITYLKGKFKTLSAQIHATWLESTRALVKENEAGTIRAPGHSENVAHYAVAMAKKMMLSHEQIEIVRVGALLHDIGKIGMPEVAQYKTKMLSDKELRMYTSHPEVGAAIVREIKFLEKEIPVIRYHHERFDGTGFPYGLRGREIPLEARIVAIANAYDNLLCGRKGARKRTVSSACTALVKEKNSCYCPDAIDAFLACYHSFSPAVPHDKKTKGRRRS